MKAALADDTSLTLFRRLYTPDELAYLARHYAHVPNRTAARVLGRSRVGVKLRAKRMGLTRRSNYTASDLAVACGCSPMTVTRWIDRGWLRAQTKAGKQGVRWVLTDRQIATFLRAYPRRWRPFSVPLGPWRAACRAHEPGSAAWHAALAPWPLPGAAWLGSFLEEEST